VVKEEMIFMMIQMKNVFLCGMIGMIFAMSSTDAQDAAPFALAFFSNDTQASSLCSGEMEMLESMVYGGYLTELVAETSFTYDVVGSIADTYSTQVNGATRRNLRQEERRLPACAVWMCNEPTQMIRAWGCYTYYVNNCRRLEGDDKTTMEKTSTNTDGNDVNERDLQYTYSGSKANILTNGRGHDTAKLYYQNIDLYINGPCKEILSQMTYKIVDMVYS
jgi:hypothetical protein